MGNHKTSEEVKAEIVSAFPPDCGELFYELSNDIKLLHLHWQNYRLLYGTSPERIELLKWAADLFFGLLENIIRHDIILRIARLTDQATTGPHSNASLPQLVEIISPHIDYTSNQLIRDLLQKLLNSCTPIRNLRNRVLVHNDLEIKLNYSSNPIPGFSRADIEKILEHIRNLANEIENCFNLTNTSFQYVHSITNAEDLIYVLEKARKLEEEENKFL